MKDWIISEFYTFLEITNRHKSILILPTVGMFLFILLDAWIQHLILETTSQASKSIIDLTPLFVKQYEKLRRIAFFEIVIVGSFFWAIKEYLKFRKRYY